ISVILSLLIFTIVTISNDIKSLTSKSDGVTYCAPRETLFVEKVVHSHNEMWASLLQIVCGCLQVAGRKVMQA
ncbi:hypothetical protein, partial [Klebsiella pneumoniae]